MKKLSTLFAFLALLPTLLAAQIFESMHFEDLIQYLDANTLVVLDIDNTLMEPVQQLGSDQWFCSRIRRYVFEGMTKGDALEQALAEWTAVQSITKVRLVEEGIDQVVYRLQNEGYTVMGLTTRGLGLSTRTIEQLKSININLSMTAPTHDEVFFMNKRGVLFRGGILFTAGTHKGHAFTKLLDKIGYKPKSIVFVNDKEDHLQELEVGCLERGIPFIGIRYGVTDYRVKNLEETITDIQFEHFGKILSDEEARALVPCEAFN